MNAKKMRTMMRLTACLFGFVAMAGWVQSAGAALITNPNPELVSKLTKELNVTPKQAMGGAGAIFSLIKSRLSPANFSKVAAAVPGMNGFLKAAPVAGGESGLGSLGSIVPGGSGGLASLATSFSSLGLSPAMISKFAPVLQNYIGSRGGSKVAALFGGAFK